MRSRKAQPSFLLATSLRFSTAALKTTMATQKKVLIWSAPRCLSTALMRSLSQIRDSQVIFEYLLLSGMDERPDSVGDRADEMVNLEVEADFNIHSWKAMYEQPYPGKSFIFAKEMSDSLAGRMEMIPQGHTHVFLIRHPSKATTSYYKGTAFFPQKERMVMVKCNHFWALAGIYDYVTQTLGQTAPVVLDAADLLAKPPQTVRLLCEATGLPFSQELLHWDQIKDELPNNWIMPKFIWSNMRKVDMHSAVFGSTCFHANRGTSGAARETDNIEPELEQLIQEALPYYDELRKHRLVVE